VDSVLHSLTVPLAHFGHWYVQILFVAPVVLLVAALSFQSWRENRRRRKKGSSAG
jgi:membrane protein implicated in regulation of membrane protease activity